MKNIVVFGATGTLGLYFVDHLANKLDPQEWTIIATGRSKLSWFSRYPNVSYVNVDIDDASSFASLPQEDVFGIVHFAGVLPGYMDGYHPRSYLETNVMGTFNILEYARTSGASRIVYTQTISDYTGYFDEMTELLDDMERRPPMTGDHSVYAISKICAEQLCDHYEATYGIRAFTLRLPNIYCFMHDSKTLYADGKPAKSSYRFMIDLAQQGKPLEVWGDPEKGMDLIYIKDFCQLAELALFSDRDKGGCYNVGTGVMTSIDDYVHDIIKVFSPKDAPSEVIYRPEKHDCVNYFMNVDKAKAELGYEPAYDALAFLEDYKVEMEQDRFADFFKEKYES
ncbi:MAG: NAD(P)-dependent oxidoreductase [Eggerthellaceae bacterium]|nr:NAD(P)-dependent oxidoreductase [Eggerthellaceae bacterium]